MNEPGIRGERVFLRPPRDEDFDVVYRLWNMREIYKYSDDAYWVPKTREAFREFFKEYHLGGGKPKPGCQNVVFIVEVPSLGVIGDCGIDIDWRRRRGEVWLEILPEHWGKGYGKEIVRLLENYARSLNLERLRAHVNGWNERSKRLFTSLGWQLKAEIPEDDWFEGKLWPTYIFEKRL